MSTRFFASVRRNQKQWMVVVTVLSMVSFLFLDDFGRGKGPMSAFGGALMIGTLCAAGMCIIGYPRQKTAEFGVGGFVVGFVAGFVGFGSVGANKPIVRTSVGNFTRAELQNLAAQRERLNQFVNAVARKAQNNQARFFGSTNEQAMVGYRLQLADARKMGIQITDERVNQFIRELTLQRLTKPQYEECLRESKLGESELFEFLKSELSAQLVAELTAPPGLVTQIPPEFAAFMDRLPEPQHYMQETPQQLWTTYKKLHVKESLEAAALPVRDFVGKVGEPTEHDVEAFFIKYKNNSWLDESRPGFVEMPRVQLAYLTGDFEKFEKGPSPTDDEVKEYYEKNKDRYRALPAKESTAPKLPDGESDSEKPDLKKDGTEKSDESTKSKEGDGKEAPSSESNGKKPDGNSEKEGASDKKKDDVKKEAPVDEKPTVEPKSKCGEEASEKTAEEKAAADKPEDLKTNPADEKTDPKKGSEKDPANADEPANVESTMPKLSNSAKALPAPTYKELNDELKFEIQSEILQERAFVQIAKELDKAYDFMVKLGLEYDTVTDVGRNKDKAKSAAELIVEKMKAYAKEHNLEYKETAELRYEELSLEPIGGAFEGKGRSPVADEVFMQASNGESRMPLYSPRRADSRSHKGAFAYWKIADLPAQVSNLKDDAVRARVVAAWKFDQARAIAKQRASDLATRAELVQNDLPAALSGESVTGVKNDPPITVIPTDKFTWLTTNQSIPNASRGPMISAIPLINNIGNDFMKTVFEDLDDGKIGVAVDEPKSVYYVVKVMNRDLPKDDAEGGVAMLEQHERFMKEEFVSRMFFRPSAYQAMAQYPQQQIDRAWMENQKQQYHVVWEENVPQPSRSKR